MPTVNPDLDWALEDVRARLPRYDLYRRYDEGDHRLLFATEKYRNAFGDLFREFADNLCEDVVDGMTARLQIIGWSAPQEESLNSVVDELWERNQGEARVGAIFRHGFREGDGFSIGQVDTQGRARSYKQVPTTMAVRYSTEAPDELEVAAKVWRAGKRYRVNLYYPDRTEKYASRGLGADNGMPKAAAFTLLRAGDPALRDDAEAITDAAVEGVIPVFHYPNGELSAYGKSILRGVIPLQDALNKAVADMLVTMEGHAAPLRWATGVQVEKDPLTNEDRDPFKGAGATPGSILRTGSKEARFGQFDASEMTGFLDVQDQFKIEIARKGYLPPHAITLRSGSSTPPSGISLLVAEGRTIKLGKDRQRDWGSEQRREMAYLANLELGTTEVTAQDLDVEWAPVETRDELALLETLALKKELGVPKRELLIEAGYASDDVDKWLAEAETAEANQAAMDYVLSGGRQTGMVASQAPAVVRALPAPPQGPAGAPQPVGGGA